MSRMFQLSLLASLVLAISCERSGSEEPTATEQPGAPAEAVDEGEAPSEPATQPATMPAPEPASESAARTESDAWRQVQPGELSETQQRQQQTAEGARNTLGSQLMARVSEAIASGGPTEAVSVCSTAAPEIAQQVSQSQGVRIGRTSHRLRNPGNMTPEWADSWVQQRIAAPAFFSGPDGTLGALYPIQLAEMCVQCHGRPEQISPEVRSLLADLYPTDQATGFNPGDLRGWFWVEVPAE